MSSSGMAAIALSATLMASSAGAATLSGTVMIAERDGGQGNPSSAVVWLQGAQGGPPAPQRVSIPMRNKAYDPALVFVPVGSTVSFPNADPILHNVFSVSGGNRFDLGLYGKGAGREVVLREPGVVRVFCNVHPQMEAVVVVTPQRWAARVAADGSFAIEDAPRGRYRVFVWDERGGSDSREVELASGDEAVSLEFRLDATSYRRRSHLDKNGRPYVGRERY